ncbi:MAG: hypothetical protein P9M11_11955 [Candidatus Tenebribacter burtonii]|jgi:hypothetical protein|nr:hypothetical protein [Candidatus Tenebribacter burtonii]
MKKTFIITLILIICSAAIAQEIDNDIIQINYEKKSLAKAMLLSSLFPGAGQFYANRRSITTYIFPLIEIGLIAGYFINYNQGLDKEADYQNFADPLYNRDHQHDAENDIIPHNTSYYEDHFRLDDENTQHFYEDIGKYDKYIFGWIDWFDIYARGEDGEFTSPNWNWDDTTNKITGVDTLNADSEYYIGNELAYDSKNGIYSGYRAEYIVMRKDAESSYDKAEKFSFGIVANHIFAAIDAVRLTKKYNRGYLSNTSKLEIKFAPVFVNNNFSPALMLTKRF